MNPKNTNPVSKKEFEIEPISSSADSVELKRISSELFRKFQIASFNLIEAESQRDAIEDTIERRRSELWSEIADRENKKMPKMRLNAADRKETVEAQLNPLKRQLTNVKIAAAAWKQLVFTYRFLADRVDTLSMLAATDKKHTIANNSVKIPDLENGENDYD